MWWGNGGRVTLTRVSELRPRPSSIPSRSVRRRQLLRVRCLSGRLYLLIVRATAVGALLGGYFSVGREPPTTQAASPSVRGGRGYAPCYTCMWCVGGTRGWDLAMNVPPTATHILIHERPEKIVSSMWKTTYCFTFHHLRITFFYLP